ncbi:hypothetical protein TPAU25S_00002 [Tsukamurella paurometabola]
MSDQVHGIGFGHHPGHHGGRVLPDRVARHGIGPGAVRPEKSRQSRLDREHGRLGDSGVGQFGGEGAVRLGQEVPTEVDAEQRDERFRDPVDGFREDGVLGVQARARACALRALAGEHPGHGARAGAITGGLPEDAGRRARDRIGQRRQFGGAPRGAGFRDHGGAAEPRTEQGDAGGVGAFPVGTTGEPVVPRTGLPGQRGVVGAG